MEYERGYKIDKVYRMETSDKLTLFHNTLGYYFLKSKEGDMQPKDMDILMTHFEALFHRHLPESQLNRTSHIHESFPQALSTEHHDHSRQAPVDHPLAAVANK